MCQIEPQNRCHKECQNRCQTEIDRIEFRTECQHICLKVCQNRCQIRMPKKCQSICKRVGQIECQNMCIYNIIQPINIYIIYIIIYLGSLEKSTLLFLAPNPTCATAHVTCPSIVKFWMRRSFSAEKFP